MRHPAKPTPEASPAPRFGSVLPGEVLPLAEAARRLGWKTRMTIDAQKLGLRSVLIGRRKYVTGDWIRQFVEAQAAMQTNSRQSAGISEVVANQDLADDCRVSTAAHESGEVAGGPCE